MPDVRTMFDKQFLYAYDLLGKDWTVTIERVVGGEVTGDGGQKTKKPILYFKGTKKGLVCNITNARTIAGLYGGSFKTEDWVGKRITLYPTTTTRGRDTVECIRIRPMVPKGKDAPPPAPPAPENREPGSDDDESAAA